MLRTINPVFKCFGVLIPALLLSFQNNLPLNLLVAMLCLVLLVQARVPMRKLGVTCGIIVLAAVGVFMTGYLYNSDMSQFTNSALLQRFGLSSSAAYGLQLASRIIAFGLLGSLFSYTTDMQQFIAALEQQLKLPAKFSYGVLAALQLVPVIPGEYRKVRHAFIARGMRPFILSPKLLAPFLIRAVKWSESLAMAMESKGFDGDAERTRYRVIGVAGRDYVFVLLLLGMMVIGTVLWS